MLFDGQGNFWFTPEGAVVVLVVFIVLLLLSRQRRVIKRAVRRRSKRQPRGLNWVDLHRRESAKVWDPEETKAAHEGPFG